MLTETPDRAEPDGTVVSAADRTTRIRRAAALLCARLSWAVVHEFTMPNGRRADLLALQPDGCFACIEVKSCARDFLADAKWPEYRAYCDVLYFAVENDFPLHLLPHQAGLIVTAEQDAELLRPAPTHKLPSARRHALLHRFAFVAAGRLAMLQDPQVAALRMALRAD